MQRIGPDLPYPLSPGIVSGNLVFLSGQVPITPDGAIPEGIEAQKELVLDQIESLLKEAGSSMDQVVKCTAFLTDESDFKSFNETYATRFPGIKPTRSTLVCKLVVPVRVEIEAVAVRNRTG